MLVPYCFGVLFTYEKIDKANHIKLRLAWA